MKYATAIGLLGIALSLLACLAAMSVMFGLFPNTDYKDVIYPILFAFLLIPIGVKVEKLENKLAKKGKESS